MCMRQCCGPNRGFMMHITDNTGQVSMMHITDNTGQVRHTVFLTYNLLGISRMNLNLNRFV